MNSNSILRRVHHLDTGSIAQGETKTIIHGGYMHLQCRICAHCYGNYLTFAMKPCIDGFLSGCRPYLAIDSAFLTGKFKGQLASATAVDGHKWMCPVCVGCLILKQVTIGFGLCKCLRRPLDHHGG
jgi:hypothetical protein